MCVRPCLWPGIMTHKKNSVDSLSTEVVVAIYLVFFCFQIYVHYP